MWKYLIFLCLILAGCGGGADCNDTETNTKVTDHTGTYWVRCWEFQCPGFPKERRCNKI